MHLAAHKFLSGMPGLRVAELSLEMTNKQDYLQHQPHMKPSQKVIAVFMKILVRQFSTLLRNLELDMEYVTKVDVKN